MTMATKQVEKDKDAVGSTNSVIKDSNKNEVTDGIAEEIAVEIAKEVADIAPAPQEQMQKAAGSTLEELAPSNVKIKKRRKWPKRVLMLLVVAAIGVVAVYFFFFRGSNQGTATGTADYITYPVERRDITVTLSGSGALQAADSYTVTTLLSGDILSADFEEGDIVEKDSVLYQIDHSDLDSNIEQAELSLSQSQTSYNQTASSYKDLNITATGTGTIVSFDLAVGDNISNGQIIATIRDNSLMKLTLPFGTDDADNIYVGQTAAVTLDGSFETLTGTVTKISTTEQVLTGNMLVRDVTIEVSNPGGISATQTATAMVGGAACNSAGTFEFKADSTVTATASGKIASIYISEGSTVTKGQTLLSLSSESLDYQIENSSTSIRNAEISLANQNKKLDDYTITSPISGTIIEKNYKQGDTIESGKTLCTIYDLSYLTMTLNVDELDISQIQVGQTVTITADAVSGATYEGYVTKIHINGTTSNGVTTYPVEIRIDEADGLLPGMNVDAELITQQSTNVLSVPSAALLRGNRVLVPTDATATDTTANGDTTAAASDAPAGYKYVQVEVGISDGDYIEITSGLNEGDMVAVATASSSAATTSSTSDMGGGMVVTTSGGSAGGPPAGGGPAGG